MSDISTDDIKQLREQTGVSVIQCKKALEQAEGDMDKAREILKKKSKEFAEKKAGRDLGAGVIGVYQHANNQVGAMVELSCETDFVAKNEEFVEVAYNIAMHVAAMNPEYLSEDDITDEDRADAREIFEEEAKELDKPEDVKKKIIEGKIEKYFADRVLLQQDYIKDHDKTIGDIVNEATQKFGENVTLRRFARLEVLG